MNLSEVEFIGDEKIIDGVQGGTGVIGRLPKPVSSTEFISMLKNTFNVKCVQANELLKRSIERVAVCGGAGSFLTGEALKAGADAFVTGEMHYHEYFDYEQKLQIAVIGHYQSEQYTTEVFKSILEPMGVKCHIAETNTNPIVFA